MSHLIDVEQAVEAVKRCSREMLLGQVEVIVDAIRAIQPHEPSEAEVDRVQSACLRGYNDWLASGKPLGEKWRTVALAAIAEMKRDGGKER